MARLVLGPILRHVGTSDATIWVETVEACIVEDRVRHVDVGRLKVDGYRRAFNVAWDVGIDADVMDATERSHTLRLDGEVTQMEAAQVFVANLGKMLPLIAPRPPVRPNDAWLDVVMVTASGPLPALLASWEAIRADGFGETDGGHVLPARARDVRIETEPDRPVELDDSVVGRTPVVDSALPRGLAVMVPPR